MNEISVIVEQTQGLVSANFEEVKRQLYVQMDEYRGMVYTEDSVKSAKEDVATLRKVRKAIEEAGRNYARGFAYTRKEFKTIRKRE